MTLPSSSSVSTRSRGVSWVGSLTQGERSMIALPTHQVKKLFAICRVLIGGHWRAAIDDLTDEFDDVASCHIVDGPRTPAAHDLAFQDAADLTGRAPFRDVLLDECINEIVDSVSDESAPRLALFGSRIAPLGSRHEHPLGFVSGDMQRDTAIGPDGVLAQARARSSGPVEDDEHLAPRRRHLHPEAW